MGSGSTPSTTLYSAPGVRFSTLVVKKSDACTTEFDSDLDAMAVNLDAKIADSVQSASKEPADRRRKRRITAV